MNTHKTRAEEKLVAVGAKLKISPRKSLVRLSQQMGLSVSRVGNAKKLLHFHPCPTPVVYKLRRTDLEARANFVNWCLHGVHGGEIDADSLRRLSRKFKFHTPQIPSLTVRDQVTINPDWDHCIRYPSQAV